MVASGKSVWPVLYVLLILSFLVIYLVKLNRCKVINLLFSRCFTACMMVIYWQEYFFSNQFYAHKSFSPCLILISLPLSPHLSFDLSLSLSLSNNFIFRLDLFLSPYI
ncbi:hypothetical protein I3843_16G100500 [Carya illinoinensis]|nr:hypothetical protein I3843_16G100500 [Carya illinoinensis]